MALQQQLRRFMVSSAHNGPGAYSSVHIKGINNNVRGFSNSQAFHEVSTIDFAYMPQSELETLKQNEILRVPILPSNSTAAGRSDEAEDAVIRPEITTVSANGTHIDSPSAMSEVTDNHAAELSPFDLTNKVTNAATAAASKITGISEKEIKEPGVFHELWSGMLDDMLGAKSMSKA